MNHVGTLLKNADRFHTQDLLSHILWGRTQNSGVPTLPQGKLIDTAASKSWQRGTSLSRKLMRMSVAGEP